MTKYREIIRLTGLGFSQRNIMASCGVAQKTVVKVQKRARELNLSWPLDESMVSAKYCYAAHESRLHQNDRCKRFALCLVLTVRFRSLAPWGKLFQLFI